MAKGEALQGELGAEPGFESMWERRRQRGDVLHARLQPDQRLRGVRAASCQPRRQQAIEVERVSDDPPERVQAWVATVTEPALAQLDLQMLLDLLRIEGAVACSGNRSQPSRRPRPNAARSPVTSPARTPCSRRWCARRRRTVGPRCEPSATKAVDRLGAGRDRAAHRVALPNRHRFRSRSLQPALSDRSGRASSGRWPTRSPEKRTPSPFAGSGALLSKFWRRRPPVGRATEELAQSGRPTDGHHAAPPRRWPGSAPRARHRCSGDADPEVQRESIHAMVEIGTTNAYSVLHRLLLEADTPRDTALRELRQPPRRQGGAAFQLRHQQGRATRKAHRHPYLDDRSPRHDETAARIDSRACSRSSCAATGGHPSAPRRSGRPRRPRCAGSGRRKRSPYSKRQPRTAAAASGRSRERR